jgi:hypothetical protein
VDEKPTLVPLESVSVSGPSVVFRKAYNAGILQAYYPPIDVHFILCHVKFEDGLYVPILKYKATCYKNLQLKIVKFFEKKSAKTGL